MKKYFFNNNVYDLIDEKTLSLPDSFVLNKKGKGAGEAKLYIGSPKSKEDENFVSAFENDNKNCFALRLDFERYLSSNINYFTNPPIHYEKLQTESFLIESLQQTQDILNFGCEVFSDEARTYIRSQDEGFKLFRLFGVSDISSIKILKLKKDDNTSYLFQIINKQDEEIKDESHIASNDEIKKNATTFTSPEQIILYGVPGSGKSHTIKEKIRNEYKITEENEDIQVTRTVFHPEYTNADFVGQILPKVVNGKTEFEFNPGPFTKILRKAMWDPEHKYVLIIEEINRGNAAAIFGELFQLLDRIDDEDKKTSHEKELNHYGKGWSDYFVMNSEINNYIRESNDEYDGKALDMNGIHFSANTGIRLPPNLSILATMNTSDQNVFTLDNAFQRRLEKILIRNEFGDTDKEKVQSKAIIETTNCTWENFQKRINELIGQSALESGLSSMEDKRLGCWFVKNKNGKITKDKFAGNVLKYLWDDAFKFSRDSIFNPEYKNFEELSKAFLVDEKGLSIFTVPFNVE